jgi:hypothetical protein
MSHPLPSQQLHLTGNDRDSFAHYMSVVAHHIRALLRKVENLEQKCFGDDSAIALLAILRRLLARLFEELSDQATEDAPGERISTMGYARTVYHLVTSLLPGYIESIGTANQDSTLAPVVEAYASIVDQIISGTNVICYPIWEHNAGYEEVKGNLSDLVEKILGPDSGIFAGISKFYVMLTYPIGREEMVLSQALMAHEIGHFLNQHGRPWSERYLDGQGQPFDPEEVNQFLSATLASVPAEQRKAVRDGAVEQITEMLKNWLEELAADLFAVCLMGPAYLFAFDEMTLGAHGSSRLSWTHPPRNLRIQTIGRLIRSLQLDPVTQDRIHADMTDKARVVLSQVEGWVQSIIMPEESSSGVDRQQEQWPTEVMKTMYEALVTAVERASDSFAHTEPPGICNARWFCGPKDIVDAVELYELLEHGLAPSELPRHPMRDPSFAAVMNGGWFAYLIDNGQHLYFQGNGNKLKKPEDVDQSYLTLQGLVAKAMEILLFKQEYRRQQGDQTNVL